MINAMLDEVTNYNSEHREQFKNMILMFKIIYKYIKYVNLTVKSHPTYIYTHIYIIYAWIWIL